MPPRYLISLIILLLAAAPSYAQDRNFDLTVRVTDGKSRRALKIGANDIATASYDIGIDKYAPPPSPGSAVFEASFQGLWFDFRSTSSDTLEYILSYQPGDQQGPVVISWDNSRLAEIGQFKLVNLPGLAAFSQDMTTTTSVNTGNHTDLEIGVVIQVVFGNSYRISPSNDTYVRGGNTYDDVNYGSEKYLLIKKGSSPDFTLHGYLQFDLTQIGTPIAAAHLKLLPISVWRTNLTNEAHLVPDDNWQEGGLTWNTQPPVTTLLSSWTPISNEEVIIDVTSVAQEAYSNDQKLSIRISSSTEDSFGRVFYGSKEQEEGLAQPVLVLTPQANQNTTLEAVADSYVRGGNAYKNNNYNDVDSLYVSKGNVSKDTYHSFVKFDLSSVQGDSIVSATVKLYPFEVVGTSGQVHEARIADDDTWQDNTLTWVNKPTVGASFASWTPVQDQVVSIDVTSDAQAAFNDDKLFTMRVSSTTTSTADWALYGNEENSDSVIRPVVEVTMAGGGSNSLPTVSITSPQDNQHFAEGDTLSIQVSASDSDGTITLVEFFADGVLLGSDTTSPYTYDWIGATVGSHVLTAVATDNAGGSTTSDPITAIVDSDLVVLEASADSYVRGGNAYKNNNYNDVDSLYVSKGNVSKDTYHSFVKFDLSSVQGDSIVSATVKLYPFEVVGTSGQVHEARIADDDTWQDNTLTWVNKPTVGASFASWTPVQDQVVSIDVTSDAQAAFNDDKLFTMRVSSTTTSTADWALYGNEENSDSVIRPVVEITVAPSGGKNGAIETHTESEKGLIPAIELLGNYPNPFRHTSTIVYLLPDRAEISLEIFDLLGRRVHAEPTYYQNQEGKVEQVIDVPALPSGVYVYRLTAVSGSLEMTKSGRMVIMK